jgi:hypothetical protein
MAGRGMSLPADWPQNHSHQVIIEYWGNWPAAGVSER